MGVPCCGVWKDAYQCEGRWEMGDGREDRGDRDVRLIEVGYSRLPTYDADN